MRIAFQSSPIFSLPRSLVWVAFTGDLRAARASATKSISETILGVPKTISAMIKLKVSPGER